MPCDVPNKATMTSSSSRICHFASSIPFTMAAYCPSGQYIVCGRTHKEEPLLLSHLCAAPSGRYITFYLSAFINFLLIICVLRPQVILWTLVPHPHNQVSFCPYSCKMLSSSFTFPSSCYFYFYCYPLHLLDYSLNLAHVYSRYGSRL